MPANSYSRMDSSGSGSESDRANESILASSPNTSSQHSGSDVEGSDKQPRFVLPSTDGSPSKVVTFDEVQHAIKSVENMSLAHELAVNPEFRLKSFEPTPNSLEARIKEMAHKAFWDVLRENIEQDPPCFNLAINLLSDIKAGFSHIISKNNQRAMDRINEILDEDVIKQQVTQGVLDFKGYATFIIDIMAKSCAPVRDEQVAKLREIDDIVDTFRGILETMSVMKLDMANCLLDSIRKDVIAHSVTYEREKFQEFLKLYTYGFPITENWLHKYKPADTTNQRWEFNAIIEAYVGLLEWDQDDKFPETLSLDEVRITGIKVKALKLCVCASAVVIASNIPLIGQNAENKAGLAKEVAIILENVKNDEDLQEIIENVWLQIKTYVSSRLLASNAVMDDLTEQSFKSQILLLANKDSSIRSLMWKRLITYFRMVTVNKNTLPAPPGFLDFVDALEICTAFKRVVLYNFSVFGDFYHEVLNKDAPIPMSVQPPAAPTATSIEEVD
ncbi:T-complex protein 11-like protein 1 [Bradysia coprophila]|uniref:T-complex protein 11-like protein 1 n=1 Tax=Bradysia coprophila TaxID=38358 RepID=UPI00187DC5F7|nr:T-complex protein 11-like protein 1 [Bradysia coprophila]